MSPQPFPDTAPIIVIGTGRCGSTLLHRILTRHSRLSWLSQLCRRFPRHPSANRLAMALLDAPLLGPWLYDILDPTEAYTFWEHLAPGFAEPDRDLVASDLTPEVAERVRETMQHMCVGSRDRLLLKITGWPRIDYLDALFDQPHFIHIIRDGRAVASSLLQRSWWRGEDGPSEWRWGELKPARKERWRRYGRSTAVLAGIQWELLVDATERAAAALPSGRYTRVRYEELCADPEHVVRDLATRTGLEWERRFAAAVREMTRSIESRNDRWSDRLDGESRHLLEASLEPALQRHGYV